MEYKLQLPVKVQYEDEYRRFSLSESSYSFLLSAIQEKCQITLQTGESLILKYLDEDEEWITFDSDIELQEGIQCSERTLRVLVELSSPAKSLSEDLGKTWKRRNCRRGKGRRGGRGSRCGRGRGRRGGRGSRCGKGNKWHKNKNGPRRGWNKNQGDLEGYCEQMSFEEINNTIQSLKDEKAVLKVKVGDICKATKLAKSELQSARRDGKPVDEVLPLKEKFLELKNQRKMIRKSIFFCNRRLRCLRFRKRKLLAQSDETESSEEKTD
jgi:hypothetical protein